MLGGRPGGRRRPAAGCGVLPGPRSAVGRRPESADHPERRAGARRSPTSRSPRSRWPPTSIPGVSATPTRSPPGGPRSSSAATVRMLGSASIDLAGVASGRLGVFLQANLHPWDWYPGAALVRGAGGVAEVVSHDGNHWQIAGNARAVAETAAALRRGKPMIATRTRRRGSAQPNASGRLSPQNGSRGHGQSKGWSGVSATAGPSEQSASVGTKLGVEPGPGGAGAGLGHRRRRRSADRHRGRDRRRARRGRDGGRRHGGALVARRRRRPGRRSGGGDDRPRRQRPDLAA